MLRPLNLSASGRRICSTPFVGVLASGVPIGFTPPAFLENDISGGDPVNCRYLVEILTGPSVGTLVMDFNSSYTFDPPTAGYTGTVTGTQRVSKFSETSRVSADETTFSFVIAAATSQVSSDLASTYSVASQVSADLGSAYGVRQLVSADLLSTYTVNAVGQVSSDCTSSYAVNQLVSQDLASDYAIRQSVSQDLAGAYAVRQVVSQDVASVYGVRQLVSQDLASIYGIGGTVSSDLASGYAVRSRVSQDLASTYSVASPSTLVSSDCASGYAVRSRVSSNCPSSYAVMSDVVIQVRTSVVPTGRVPLQNKPRIFITTR